MARRDEPEIILQTLLLEAVERAEAAVSVYDDEGRYVAVNERACELLGRSKEDILARDVGDFTDGGFERAVLLNPARREGVRLVRRSDGSSVPVAYVVVPTRISRLSYYLAFWWEIEPDDPRADGAS